MSKEVNYLWGDNNLLIDLGGQSVLKKRAFLWSELLLTICFATLFLISSFSFTEGVWGMFAVGCACVLFLLASYRFISRMFASEKLILKPEYLQIINRSPFYYKVEEYDWDGVGTLHYAGQQKAASSDSLMQYFYNQGSLLFIYNDKEICFGKGMPIWDAEEVVNMMLLYKGDKITLGPEWDLIMHQHELTISN